MNKRPVKLTAAQEEEIKQKLLRLSQQDEMLLPESLRSPNLLAKLQEQPSFARIDSDQAPRRRSVYVITTCAAALLMVVGLSRIMPGLSSDNFSGFAVGGANALSSSSAASAQSITGKNSDYQEIITALQYLTGSGVPAGSPEEGAPPAAPAAETASVASETNENDEAPSTTQEKSSLADGKETALRSTVPPAFPEDSPEESSDTLKSGYSNTAVNGVKEDSVEATEEELGSSSNAEPYALMDTSAPPSGPVSSTGKWTYWLSLQSNTLQQLSSQTMEQTAQAVLPHNSMVSDLESYGDLVACIDPYQFSYNDENGLSAAETSGVTVYLYQTDGTDEAVLQPVSVISMSGVYETSYLSSDGLLYLVSNQRVNADAESIEEVLSGLSSGEEPYLDSRLTELLPIVYDDSTDGGPSLLPPMQISLIGTPAELNYLNVMVVDLANSGACTFWAFLGRKGDVSIYGHSISMVAADGNGEPQLVSIDLTSDHVSYRISKSILLETETAAAEPLQEPVESDAYYPPPV